MQFPAPVRAVIGLLANAAEEAKHLPDRAIELPMLAVSTALQASLRAQQRYARLAARGDEVLNRRRPTDEPPAWATFDEPVPLDELRRGALDDDQARAASDLLDELLGSTEGPTSPEDAPPPAEVQLPAGPPSPADVQRPAEIPPADVPSSAEVELLADAAPAAPAGANGATPAADAPAAKAPARKAANAPAKKAAVRKAPAKRAADAGERGKSVSKPRHTAPSRFDAVDDGTD